MYMIHWVLQGEGGHGAVATSTSVPQVHRLLLQHSSTVGTSPFALKPLPGFMSCNVLVFLYLRLPNLFSVACLHPNVAKYYAHS